MILRFKDIVKKMDASEVGGASGEIHVSVTNIDDIFRVLRKRKIKEVRVDFDEMYLAMMFIVVNAQVHRTDLDNPKNDIELNWKVISILQEGKIDKLFDIKLVLEE